MVLKKLVKRAFIMFSCGMLFFSVSYAYLRYNINKVAEAQQKDYTVPYEHVPDNAGIGFLLPDSSAVLVYLNFENGCINVVNIENYDENNSQYYGYTVDYTIEVTAQLISGIVDRVGGINIQVDGKTLRYTGVQVVELISGNKESNIKSQIIREVFRQISKSGFSKENFVYIIQNTNTDLSLLDCIYWMDYIDNIRGDIKFIN